MKRNSQFPKNSPIFVNIGQFLNVGGNFLLSIGSDSFPILPEIECSSIRKFGKSGNIMNFSNFHRNNVFTQYEHEFRNYELRKKIIFHQLGIKIINFANNR